LLGLPVWLIVKCFKRLGTASVHRCDVGWVLLAEGALFAALLKRHPFGTMQAVAVGCCVFASDTKALADCLPHELVHVKQAQRWGVIFPLAYLACSVWARLNGGCAYQDNWFERQANQAAA
jgi:hypothetical protein